MKFIRYKKLIKKYYWLPLLVIALIFLVALLLRVSMPWLEERLILKSEPFRTVHSYEAVELEAIFNDNPGSELFSEIILEEINQAQNSIEIAMYAFSSLKLKEALYAADKRGVKVKIITDARKEDSHQMFFADAPKSIMRIAPSTKSTLMHHKFTIIDRGLSNQKLIFGAYNWTDLQEKYDPSFIAISSNTELVASFGREFDRLWTGFSGRSKFETENYSPWDLALSAPTGDYEVWFSPGKTGDSIKGRLLDLVKNAETSLKIMIWDFTDEDLAVEMIRRARQGLEIKIVTDTWNFNNKHSVFHYLLEAKDRYNLDNFDLVLDHVSGDLIIEVAGDDIDNTFDPFLHHHLMIVDDKIALFGTNNWSRSGAFSNDESIMVTNDQKVVSQFLSSFNLHYGLNAE
jgi:phosphatidylserine/phosphatidylglycerophosphate/cardiolipin synthase-like enzyme